MRYIVANWKMNLGVGGSLKLLDEVSQQVADPSPVEVVLCPSMLALMPVVAKNKGKFDIGAQNCFWEDAGAYTGEVSAAQLAGLVKYCLVGHSERRQALHETDTEVNKKVRACLRQGIRPIICIGETLNQRQNGETEITLRNQLDGALMGVSASEISQVLVAYEPTWAIGSGETPTNEDLTQAVHTIKTQIEFMYGRQDVPVLYGGSVNEANAEDIVSLPQIDGLLVGNIGLNAEKFGIIVEIMKRGSRL